MGLDATVYCDCFERNQLRVPPRVQWQVYVDESGARFSRTENLEADLLFDAWNATACDHERGVLLHHWLGNIALISNLRESLRPHSESLPLIFSKVIYSATHCGDYFPAEQLPLLSDEVVRLSTIQLAAPADAERLATFQEKMSQLLQAAIALGKPISF